MKLTEKWKHFGIVLPGEVIIFFIVCLTAHLAGQSTAFEVLEK